MKAKDLALELKAVDPEAHVPAGDPGSVYLPNRFLTVQAGPFHFDVFEYMGLWNKIATYRTLAGLKRNLIRLSHESEARRVAASG